MDKKDNPGIQHGAIDFTECPNYPKPCRCKPPCVVCGFNKHMAIHGPLMDQPPGSEPYDHVYVAKWEDWHKDL
jgi:hypothetical protein